MHFIVDAAATTISGGVLGNFIVLGIHALYALYILNIRYTPSPLVAVRIHDGAAKTFVSWETLSLGGGSKRPFLREERKQIRGYTDDVKPFFLKAETWFEGFPPKNPPKRGALSSSIKKSFLRDLKTPL